MDRIKQCLSAAVAAAVLVLAAGPAPASQFVKMQFNLFLTNPDGSPFDTVYIELFDDTPLNQANFLNYVNDDDYNNVIMHRLVHNFVLQGGGFTWNGSSFDHIPTDDTVDNEFARSNVRGTLAMAKLGADAPGGGPDSATSEFFFNLVDNSANLDAQNGGFTVFGRVLGNGMDLIDAFATLSTYNVSSLTNVPLLNGNQFLLMTDVSQVALRVGDTNFDGDIDQDDADLLSTVLLSGSDEPQYDVDANGLVEQADLDRLNALLAADLDGDGFVGVDDLNILLVNWNQGTPLGDDRADANGDGFVGVDDLNLILSAWNAGSPPPPVSVVPEPAALGLLGLGAGVLTLRRRG